MRMLAVLAVFFVAVAGTAAAQAPPSAPATPRAITDVYACAQISDSTQRLACYDTAVGRLHDAESQGQVVAIDREQARTVQRESFGFHLPSLSRLLPGLRGPEAQEQIDDVQMTVAHVNNRAYGFHSFVMNDGQIWTQVEPQDVRNVRPGDIVTIHQAALGSFRLTSPRGGAGHRVRREG